ncbi:MAG: phosphoenolpyruvate--protein phosphotransferase [Betaproteobacteria bacterium]|jgi:phosphotransferase system enzyme I (PtsI)|nr:phosphoenolpyruvate--protein phosphotransferase [Betaproteobacteria bacterium]
MVTFALHGVGVSGGIAIGRAQLVSHATLEVAHYVVPASRVDHEIARLELAIDEVQKELTELHGTMTRSGDLPGEFGAFLDVHWMILNDPTLSEAPKRIIAEQRCNAEWALTQQMNVLIDQFEQIEDSYLRERKADVVQVVERVLKRLMGKPGSLPTSVAEERTILVAHDLSPADVIQFKQHHFAAFLTDVGGVTSHTAIVARSLAVPAVVATHNARQMIHDGEMLIVDGTSHVVIVNPDRSVLAEYRLKQSELDLERQKLKRLRGKPAETLDGHRVELHANIELPGDLAQVLESGANGVGLFRSEFLFLNRAGLPTEDEQFEAYRAVAAGLAGKPVTIRTFDLGADKQKAELDGLARVAPNPALGLRAVRFCLAEPKLFLTQLRAILRASHYGKVRLLIPMLASVAEIDATLAMIGQAKETLRERGEPFDEGIEVGGMIEVPAAVLAIGGFLAKLDFLSIGTNDLIQYTLAVDRSDEAVSHLYDPLHPAIIKLIALAIAGANRAKVPIAVCGEMAGETTLTRVLLGLGLRNFSMHPAQVPTVKQRVLTSDVSAIRPVVERMKRTDSPAKLAALLDKLNA